MNSKALTIVMRSLLTAAVFTLTSCSSTPPPPPPPTDTTHSFAFVEGVPGGVMVDTFEVTAKVTAVDKAKRKVTIQRVDGEKLTVKAPPDAVNFDQLNEGDQIHVTVTKEMVIYLNKEGSSSDGSVATVVLAPKGAPAGRVAAETTQLTARVTAIDEANRTATLQFEDGTTKTLPVRKDLDLSQHKLGEQVVFRVTEMIAIRLQKP